MKACVKSCKVIQVRSNVASNLGDIKFWYFSPNNCIEKQKCKYNHNDHNRHLKMNNLIQTSPVLSSKEFEKSSFDYQH